MNSTIGGMVLMVLLIIILATVALTLLGPAFIETKTELRETEAELEKTEIALEDAEGALGDLTKDYSLTRADLETAEATIESLDAENIELWADNSLLWQKLEEAGATIETLRSENGQLREKLGEADAKVLGTDAELAESGQIVEQLQLELADAHQKLQPFWQGQERARLREELRLKEQRECVLLGLALGTAIVILIGGGASLACRRG